MSLEALGAAGTALALAGAAHSAASQSIKFLKRIRKAPQELNDLILCENDHQPDALKLYLEDAHTQLLELKSFVKGVFPEGPEVIEVNRVFWATHKEHVQKLCLRLRSIRDDITTLVTVNNFLQTISVNQQLKELILTTQKHRAETQQQLLAITNESKANDSYLDQSDKSNPFKLSKERKFPQSEPKWSQPNAYDQSAQFDSGPELLLQTIRLIRTDAYAFAESGKLDDLRKMYANGEASVHDADPPDGENALMAAVRGQQIDVIRFLLDCGANRAQVDHSGFTAGDYAICTAYSYRSTAISESLRGVFDLGDAIDDQDFTSLHRIIIGLSRRDLSEEVEEHPNLVDTVDSKGRSPLWWTAWCNKPSLAKILLDARADPLRQDAKGQTALHQCARIGCTILAQVLLQSGDIDNQGASGQKMMNIQNHVGHCPWHSAIFRNNADVLKVFLEYGCNFEQGTSRGMKVFHLAARYGNLKTAEVLQSADLTKVDPDTRDTSGMTAAEYLSQYHAGHPGVPERCHKTVKIFEDLLRSTGLKFNESIERSEQVFQVKKASVASSPDGLPAVPGAWPSTR
ncbi:hypothetical protein ACLMJK_008503 [Lecanora helva]